MHFCLSFFLFLSLAHGELTYELKVQSNQNSWVMYSAAKLSIPLGFALALCKVAFWRTHYTNSVFLKNRPEITNQLFKPNAPKCSGASWNSQVYSLGYQGFFFEVGFDTVFDIVLTCCPYKHTAVTCSVQNCPVFHQLIL